MRRAGSSRLHSFAKYWSRLTLVSVISPEYGQPEGKYSRIQYPIPTYGLANLNFLRVLPHLLRFVQRMVVDVVFSSYPQPSGQFLTEYLLARRLGCPLVVDIRDLPTAMLTVKKGTFLGRITKRLRHRLIHYFFSKATRIGTVTDHLREQLIKALNYQPARIYVIRNGSETELFKRAFTVKKEFDLVFSGKLFNYRDPQSMLRFLRELADLYPALKVLFIAEVGKQVEEEFFQGIRDLDLCGNIELEEMGPPELLPERLGRARLGFTSLKPRLNSYEGVASAKNYEYLASGLPVIGLLDSDFYIELRRLITDNQVGILHPHPKLLAEQTAALLKDPARLRRMSKRARKVGERFDRKRLAEEYYYKVILPAWEEFNASRLGGR
ncbi:MAG: glycosyltransferase [candidate division WOR-3 bacterium]|nr:glycosyltransferase [candidate division WOR-3 bacterium]